MFRYVSLIVDALLIQLNGQPSFPIKAHMDRELFRQGQGLGHQNSVFALYVEDIASLKNTSKVPNLASGI